MGKVIYEVSMSLDGFITGANPRPEEPNGDGGLRLVEWAFNSADPRNREIVAGGRTRVRLLLAEPHMTSQSPIGEQTGQPALLGYQRLLFPIVCPKIYPMEVSIVS